LSTIIENSSSAGQEKGERLPNVHPGDVLREDFLKPLGMTSHRLAKGLGMPPSTVSDILRGKRAVSASTALRLSRFLGPSARFWMNLQVAYDLEEAERSLGEELARLERYPKPPQGEDEEEGK
jgi:addiction module HigA family antidote